MSEIKTATHAAEGGHWYTKDGQQVIEVAGKKATLRHARKLNLGPGVTSIIGMADRPALNRWREDQVLMAALTLPRHEDESEQSWVKRVKEDAKSAAERAADEGTRIHAALECSFSGRGHDPNYQRHVDGVRALLLDTLGTRQEWIAERSCACSVGYGTKSDLCSPFWIIDFKGCDGSIEQLRERTTYEEHAMQLSATRVALGTDYGRARCAILYVSRTHPGACWMVEVKSDDLERGWQMFNGLLVFWQAKNRYKPNW